MNRSWSRTLIVVALLQWLNYKTLQLLFDPLDLVYEPNLLTMAHTFEPKYL